MKQDEPKDPEIDLDSIILNSSYLTRPTNIHSMEELHYTFDYHQR